jgi:hypothetical protein
MSEQQGPQNFLQFLFMVVKAYITGLPKMIKSFILTAVISGVMTLGLHFYLLLFPNDGYNASGDPFLDSILVLADRPLTPNVLLYWFLLNFLFWWIVGVFAEKGIGGGIKQFASTPVFILKSLGMSGLASFPLLLGGVALAFVVRLLLADSTSLQMCLLMLTFLVGQAESIPIMGIKLALNDAKGLVGRKVPAAEASVGEGATFTFGAFIGFAYLSFFPFNLLIAQAIVVLMVVGIVLAFMKGRGKGKVGVLAMALMIVCLFAVSLTPALADDGGAAESGGAGNVIGNPTLRDFMIKQGVPASLAGIAAALAAQGKLTPGLFDQLKKGKLGPRPGETPEEMVTRHKIEKQLLKNLQHMQKEVWFGKGQKLWKEKGAPGNINDQIDKVINDLLSGKGLDLNKYDKIFTVYTGHVSGRTITEDMIPTSNELNQEILQNTIAWTTKEIITGTDIDGNFSWSSLGLRIILGGVTLGKSESVYIGVNSYWAIKNYVDKGGNSILGGFWAGIKEAGWQIAIGQAIGAGFGLLGRGAGAVGKYLGNKFPNVANGAKNIINKISKVLNTELKWPGRGGAGGKPPTVTGPKGTSIPSKINSQVAKAPAVPKVPKTPQSPYPGLKNPSFQPAGKPPNLKGMTVRDQKALKVVCDKHGVTAQMRPTSKYAKSHIESGKAAPKPEPIKAKSINDIDANHLGYPKGDNRGLVACKKPNPLPKEKPPNMTNQEWRDVKKRWVQREREFRDTSGKYQEMHDKGQIYWDKETGIIHQRTPNGGKGKPYAGDNDAFAFVDPVTGKPVSPTVNNAVNQDLQKMGVTTHNEHVGWDYSGSSRVPTKPGGKSQWQMDKKVDSAILNGHAPGGEPLNTYNPLNSGKSPGNPNDGWSTSWWTGGQRI